MSSSISMIRPQGFPRTKRRRKANGEYDDEKFRGRSMSQPTAPCEQRRLGAAASITGSGKRTDRADMRTEHFFFLKCRCPRPGSYFAKECCRWRRVGNRITFALLFAFFFIYKKKKHRFPTPTRLSQRRSPVSFAGLLHLLHLLLHLLQQRFRKRHP